MPTSTQQRSIPGILFVVAGALVLARFAAIASSLDVDVPLRFLSPLVLAAALVTLAVLEARGQATRVALIIAAAGWALIGIAVAVTAVPPFFVFVAQIVVVVATIVAAVTAARGNEYPQRARLALAVFAVITAVFHLSAIFEVYGSVAALILVIFAISTAAVGYFLVTRR